eukprot:4932351-Pleurochrysis_carterae.AAC.7
MRSKRVCLNLRRNPCRMWATSAYCAVLFFRICAHAFSARKSCTDSKEGQLTYGRKQGDIDFFTINDSLDLAATYPTASGILFFRTWQGSQRLASPGCRVLSRGAAACSRVRGRGRGAGQIEYMCNARHRDFGGREARCRADDGVECARDVAIGDADVVGVVEELRLDRVGRAALVGEARCLVVGDDGGVGCERAGRVARDGGEVGHVDAGVAAVVKLEVGKEKGEARACVEE